MTDVISLAEWRVKRRLKRAREWADVAGTVMWCMACGEEFLYAQRDEHACRRHPSQQ
jgi:hypothetical protein